MCLSVPGKIVKIKGNIASIDYGSEKREAKIIEGDLKVGDFVIVQNKVIVEKISEEQVAGWLNLLKSEMGGQGDGATLQPT